MADADISTQSQPSLGRLRSINWNQYDGLIHAGDFAYDVNYDGGSKGDSYFNSISDLTARVPYLIVAGNHENYDNAKLFDYRFKMPGYNADYNNNLWVFKRG